MELSGQLHAPAALSSSGLGVLANIVVGSGRATTRAVTIPGHYTWMIKWPWDSLSSGQRPGGARGPDVLTDAGRGSLVIHLNPRLIP
jgi:hypothetical protein